MEITVAVADVGEDEPLRVRVTRRHAVGVYRDGDTFYCIDDWCPHGGGYITQGPFEDCIALCPIHGFQFDVRDGRCLHGRDFDVRAYRVTRRGDMLIIDVDDADPSQGPPLEITAKKT